MVACHSCVSKLIEFVFAGENNHRKNAVEMGLTLKKHVVNCRAPAVLQTLSVQLSTTGVGSIRVIRYGHGVRVIRYVDVVRGIRYVDVACGTRYVDGVCGIRYVEMALTWKFQPLHVPM